MARTEMNAALTALRGELDGYVYKTFKHGGGCISRRPKPKGGVLADGTRRGNERFRQATAYASAALKEPEMRSFYEWLARKRRAWRVYNLVTADFMNAPTIDDVALHDYRGARDGVIRILASDDVGVIGIRVEIRDTTGKIWEYGLATLEPEPAPRVRATKANRRGCYRTTQDIPPGTELEIEVGADDRAGNRTTARRRFKIPAHAG